MRVKVMMRTVTLTHALMRIVSIKMKLNYSSFCWNPLNDHFVNRGFIVQLFCRDFMLNA